MSFLRAFAVFTFTHCDQQTPKHPIFIEARKCFQDWLGHSRHGTRKRGLYEESGCNVLKLREDEQGIQFQSQSKHVLQGCILQIIVVEYAMLPP